jgi:CheY-like chemotaxis protein
MIKRDEDEVTEPSHGLVKAAAIVAPREAAERAASAAPVPSSVLLVEDNVIIAWDAEETLKSLGVGFVITASSVSQALAAIEKQSPAFALLDVDLGIETSFAVAEQLMGAGIPFAFVTGYGEQIALPAIFADVPKIGKPYSVDTLRAVLSGGPTL